jgi:hypothetical protein
VVMGDDSRSWRRAAKNVACVRIRGASECLSYVPICGGCQAFSLLYLGLMVAGVAALLWETSERLCPRPGMQWLRFLRLHAMWHIAVSYSVFLILQVRAATRRDR